MNDEPLVGEDGLPGERPDQIRHEERRHDEQKQEVLPATATERDPVRQRIAEDECQQRCDTGVFERANEMAVVVAERVPVVTPRPRRTSSRRRSSRTAATGRPGSRAGRRRTAQVQQPRRQQQVRREVVGDGGRNPPSGYAEMRFCQAVQILLVVQRVGVEDVHVVEHLLRREDERVIRDVRVDCLSIAGACARWMHRMRDVVGSSASISALDLRVVDEVHVRRGRVDVATLRDQHVVRPDDRRRPSAGSSGGVVVGLQLRDVARPRHCRGEIALRERRGVVVPGELPDLLESTAFLMRLKAALNDGVRHLRRVVAVREHHDRHRVAHRVETA